MSKKYQSFMDLGVSRTTQGKEGYRLQIGLQENKVR